MKTVFRALIMALLIPAATALAQGGDLSVLHPPKGSRVAVLVFEDLECPRCASIEPLLEEAAKQYKVPLVRYDFPLPMHPWSFDAHVLARYFDTKSKALGEEFRRWIFANQRSITAQNLRGMAERFAGEHHVALPAFVDPSGALANEVKQDFALGQKVGVNQTPTIYVVTDTRANPVMQVPDTSQLFSTLDRAVAQANAEAPAKPTKNSSAAHKSATQ